MAGKPSEQYMANDFDVFDGRNLHRRSEEPVVSKFAEQLRMRLTPAEVLAPFFRRIRSPNLPNLGLGRVYEWDSLELCSPRMFDVLGVTKCFIEAAYSGEISRENCHVARVGIGEKTE